MRWLPFPVQCTAAEKSLIMGLDLFHSNSTKSPKNLQIKLKASKRNLKPKSYLKGKTLNKTLQECNTWLQHSSLFFHWFGFLSAGTFFSFTAFCFDFWHQVLHGQVLHRCIPIGQQLLEWQPWPGSGVCQLLGRMSSSGFTSAELIIVLCATLVSHYYQFWYLHQPVQSKMRVSTHTHSNTLCSHDLWCFAVPESGIHKCMKVWFLGPFS